MMGEVHQKSFDRPTSRGLIRMTISAVLLDHGIHPDDFFGLSRQPHFVKARQDAATRLIDFGYSANQVARALKRNHTTVLNYLPAGKEARASRYAGKRLLRHLSEGDRQTVLAYAKAENVTPEVLMAQWVGERASYEAQAKARAA